jgi:hypothetical protein
MADTLPRALFLAGFLVTWLGLVLLMVPMVFRALRGPWRRTLSSSYAERFKAYSQFTAQEILTVGRTGAGRWGQRVLAVGLSTMMLAGLLWLTLKIIAQPS